MSIDEPVPEPWATRMIERGFTDPRYRSDMPSLSRLAEAVGSHPSTLRAYYLSRTISGHTSRQGVLWPGTGGQAMIQGLMRWLRSPLLTGWSVVVVDGGRELPLVGVWSREAAQTRAQLLAVEHPGLAFRACPIAR